MAAIARAGIPQAAFPFMADQFSNRDNIFKLGLGQPSLRKHLFLSHFD